MFVNFMYSTPLQMIFCIYMLWGYLNYSVLVGVGVLVLLMPLNMLAWHAMEIYQKEQMKLKDERVNLISEILNGIKVLKLYAWEKSFVEQINEIRNGEIRALKLFQYLEGSQFMMWNCAPFLVAVTSFATFVMVDPVNNILDAKTAFVSLTLFNTLREPLFLLPFGIVNIIQGMVSLKRIAKYLNADEIDPTSVTHDDLDHQVLIQHATFTWGKSTDRDILKDISIKVKEGSLIAVVGQVGSGKSSLLSAILGEMTRKKGVINVSGSVAYVSQQAWMRNMTLKENILFSKKHSKRLYDKTIQKCALTDDIAMLPDGDATEIGEKGINLSGGQKQRINLARAVYSNRDVYLLDDPLSAVDAHVGKHIFENVIGPKGILNKKTRLLVTHGVTFLPETDMIIVLKNGTITEMGSYEYLINQKGDFADFILEQLQKAEDSETETDTEQIWKTLENSQGKDYITKKNLERSARRRVKTESLGSLSPASSDAENARSTFTRQTSISQRSSYETEYKSLTKKKLIEDETAEIDSVKSNIYVYYIISAGLLYGILSLFGYFLYEACSVGANIWLSVWSDDERASYDTGVRNMYLSVYGIIGLFQSAFIFLAILFITFATINASIKLHDQLLVHILGSPMSFFDTTPVGRITNRFSKDIDEVDIMLPLNFKDMFNSSVNVLGVVFVLSYVQPIMLVAIIPLTLFFFGVQSFYLQTSRQLKRIMSINQSPINSHIEETLTGAPIIRAYRFEDQFENENEEKIDELQMSRYPEAVSNSWLFLRLQLIGMILIIANALITVINRDTVDPGVLGLSLSYVLSIQMDIYFLVRRAADLEKSLVSVERIKEYQETPQEAMRETPNDPDQSWPEYGNIKFDHYSTRYRPGLDLVLSDISCSIKSGEKIGIVGRTGAGKSSITLSLFRIIESAAGAISIDGVNIAQIGLTRLRSALTIIPQDPVLFSGTLRFNLDPFALHTDRYKPLFTCFKKASQDNTSLLFNFPCFI